MSSEPAISVRGLSKSYRIAHQSGGGLRQLFNRSSYENFEALTGLDFDIFQGQAVGVIGRNGAGKSTLLKILSRITEPTSGKAVLVGRVGSLLEVGTGFHGELTGRENIFLNGAFLGMTRREIQAQFDAIVEFSGTERFLDTPVKRYSSGMYVRLAFAVAAHLNPEILIVDEVLAVGDAEFQKKCLGKMQDVATSGRTILFVSHAMASIQQLCNRCIYLKQGKIQADGPAQQVIEAYISEGQHLHAEKTWELAHGPGNDLARMLAVRILDSKGKINGDLSVAESFVIEMDFAVLAGGYEIAPVFHLVNMHGVTLFANPNTQNKAWMGKKYEPGVYRVRVCVPGGMLNDGGYFVKAHVTRGFTDFLAWDHDAVRFELHDDETNRGGYGGLLIGAIRPSLPWEFEQLGDLPR